MEMPFMRQARSATKRSRELALLVLEMHWNEDREHDSSVEDEEIIRMIQLNGMIGTDPELAEVG